MTHSLPRWVAASGVAGLTGVWVRRLIVRKRPIDAPLPIPRRIPGPQPRPSPDGTAVRILVNTSAGPAWSASPVKALREGLPGADIHELGPDEELVDLLCDDGLVAMGAAGGDGTLGGVAVIAADRGLPFVAVPAGTLNHLARDLGLTSVDDAVAAVRAGTTTRMDLAMAGDRCFVNTLSLGGYPQVVDARERMESRIGKWPALLVALMRELPRMEPLLIEVDGNRMRVWLAWIGNCQYAPPGFGPAWRECLDDGVLDVRIVNGSRRFSRARFVVHLLTGRLRSCPVYEERSVSTLSIRSLEGPLRLAADGETYDGPVELEVSKRPRALEVAVPPYGERSEDNVRRTTTAGSPRPAPPRRPAKHPLPHTPRPRHSRPLSPP